MLKQELIKQGRTLLRSLTKKKHGYLIVFIQGMW